MRYQKKENGLFVQCQRFIADDENGQNMELYKYRMAQNIESDRIWNACAFYINNM